MTVETTNSKHLWLYIIIHSHHKVWSAVLPCLFACMGWGYWGMDPVFFPP